MTAPERAPKAKEEPSKAAAPKTKVGSLNMLSLASLSRKTILLVDDEEPMRRFLSKALEGEGYNVMVAGDGEAALAMSESFQAPIHLLITDVMMPVMNGKELADRLCTLRPELKVLFVSGFSRADIWPVDSCEDVTDWLPKPFSRDQFRARVRQLLGTSDRH
jgi:two-component system, cell cycle sensor histidine kinase and response regulator CckA